MDLDALVTSAKAEGAVTVYIAASAAIIRRINDAFTEKYGFAPQMVDMLAAALKTKVQAEIQAGQLQADMFVLGERGFFDALGNDLRTISDLPSWIAFPDKYKGQTTALVGVQEKGLLYNTSKVKPGDITSWTSLLEPRWKSQIAIGAASTSVSTTLAYVDLATTLGDDFIQKLAAQDLSWQFGGGALAAMVASGEKAIAFPSAVGQYQGLKATGAPIGWIDMDPQSGAEQYTGILAKARHPNAAQLMVNFLLSAEGQEALNGEQSGASVLPNVPNTLSLSPGFRPLDESIPTSERDRVLKLLGSP